MYPENSMEGFLSLLEIGADGLELDLVISGDKKVVVSHEPFMAASYMLTPDGRRIKKSEEKNYRLYDMSYDSIRRFDSGSHGNSRFPGQKKLVTFKPLLKEVFTKIEARISTEKHQPVKYYLEMKSDPEGYGITQPYPEEFADLVMEVVRKNIMLERVVLKSFDTQLLNTINSKYPEVRISYLLYKTSIAEALTLLDFKPEIISPYFKQLSDRESVLALQEEGFEVIPWTVNQQSHIIKMIKYGVDGIISDYPERVLKQLKNRR